MTRIISIWIPVVAAGITSYFCWVMADKIGASYTDSTGGAAVPLLSELYYPEAFAIYLYPIFFGVWAIFATIRKLSNEHAILLITATLGFTLVFLVGWIFGMVLPFTYLVGSAG